MSFRIRLKTVLSGNARSFPYFVLSMSAFVAPPCKALKYFVCAFLKCVVVV